MLWTNVYSLEKLGAFLQDTRKQQGRTQNDFAELIGVSHATLSALENGRNVSTVTLEKALQFLGLRMVIVPKSASVHVDEKENYEQRYADE